MTAALVIQTSFIGDVILTTPLLTALAQRGAVDVVTTPAGASLLAGHPAVRRIVEYDKRGSDAGAGGFLRLVGRLRGVPEPYAAAYLAQGSVRSALLARLARIPVRVGFASSAGRGFYTHWVTVPDARHHAERLWRLAHADGTVPDEMPRPSLHPGPEDRRAVDELLGGDPRPLIALAPGSVWATKRWPYFEALAVALAHHGRLAVIGGPDDSSLGEIISLRVPGSVNAAGRLSLLRSAELLRRARVVVTNDSSPTHLASAMQTPTVTIFGPTTPGFGFGPLAPRHRVVLHEPMPCRPCHHHGPRACPLGHWRCMVDLTAATVAAAVREVGGLD